MADPDDTSKRSSRRHQTDAPPSAAPSTAPPIQSPSPNPHQDFSPSPLLSSPLVAAIEAERAELLRAHSLAKCLYEVLLNADYYDAVNHADVANMAARLIDESVTRLDIVRLGPMIEALQRKPLEPRREQLTVGYGGKNEVRDGPPLPAYLS